MLCDPSRVALAALLDIWAVEDAHAEMGESLPSHCQHRAASARRYLDEHALLPWAHGLFKELMRDQPSDPWAHIEESAKRARTAKSVIPPGGASELPKDVEEEQGGQDRGRPACAGCVEDDGEEPLLHDLFAEVHEPPSQVATELPVEAAFEAVAKAGAEEALVEDPHDDVPSGLEATGAQVALEGSLRAEDAEEKAGSAETAPTEVADVKEPLPPALEEAPAAEEEPAPAVEPEATPAPQVSLAAAGMPPPEEPPLVVRRKVPKLALDGTSWFKDRDAWPQKALSPSHSPMGMKKYSSFSILPVDESTDSSPRRSRAGC